MADIGSSVTAVDGGPDVGTIVTPTVTALSALIGFDTALNPIGVSGKDVRTADLWALLEWAKIALMDHMADNLR